MSVTITDVAKHAGVSIETVSRVINDGPFVVEATHAKVVAAMQELGYVPNASARRLASGCSPVLGLVFHNATSDYINNVPYEMARHLLSLGHKHIGFIMGNPLSLASEKASCGKVYRSTNIQAHIDDMVAA